MLSFFVYSRWGHVDLKNPDDADTVFALSGTVYKGSELKFALANPKMQKDDVKKAATGEDCFSVDFIQWFNRIVPDMMYTFSVGILVVTVVKMLSGKSC